MSLDEDIILDLDSSEDERPVRTPRTKTAKAAPRGPRSRNPRPVADESENDEASQPVPGVKRERSESAVPDKHTPKKRQKSAKAPDKPPLEILAVDFGMWGIGNSSGPPTGDPRSVRARKEWPHDGGARTSKLPAYTALREDNPNHRKFSGRKESYTGFEVLNDMLLTAYSKLCMARTIAPSPLDDDIWQEPITKKVLRPSEPAKYKKAMVQILKYIRRIYLENVASTLGRALQPDDNFHYVFTYPAACSEEGRRTLREAVRRAGFEDRHGDKVTYISEAHAAASAAFIDSRWMMNMKDFKEVFKKNKAVTVLDCGALTVDATTIQMLGNDSRLRIAEICVSNGGNCGTTAILSRFLKALEDKFGPVFAAVPPKQLDRGSQFYKDCESILRSYTGPPEDDDFSEDGDTPEEEKYEFSVRLPDGFIHDDYDPDLKKAYLWDSEIQRAFDENFEYIKAIVRDQWEKHRRDGESSEGKNDCVNTDVIATGGGSLCLYIEKSVERFCKDNGVRCIRMQDRDSAVCRGALINAMNENFFGWRLSRAYFGILVRENGRTYIKWFIRRGQQINVKEGLVIKRCPGRLKLNNGTIHEILHGMSLERPGLPICAFQGHLEDDQNPPDQPTDIGVEKVGRIVIDGSGFSESFRKKLQKSLNDGVDQSVKATISVTVDGSGRLFFVAKSNRINLGQGELRYDVTEVAPVW